MSSDAEALKQKRAESARKAREAKQIKAQGQQNVQIPIPKDVVPKQPLQPPPIVYTDNQDYSLEAAEDEPMDDDLDAMIDGYESEREEEEPKEKKKRNAPRKKKPKLATKPVEIKPPKKEKSKTKASEPKPQKRKREEEASSDSEEEEAPKKVRKKSKINEPGIMEKLYTKVKDLDLSDETFNYMGTLVGILGVLVYIRCSSNTRIPGDLSVNQVNQAPAQQQSREPNHSPNIELGQPVPYRYQ